MLVLELRHVLQLCLLQRQYRILALRDLLPDQIDLHLQLLDLPSLPRNRLLMIRFHRVNFHGLEVGEGGALVFELVNLAEGVFDLDLPLVLFGG